MKFTKLALTVMCSMMLFCACTKSNDVVLKVNDEAITNKEYYEDFNRIKNVQFKNAPKEFQKDNSYPVLILKDRYTNDVIVRKLLAQEFAKRKIEATPEEIEAKKKATAEQIGSEEQLQKILKENNIPDEKFTNDMMTEVKIEKLVDELGGAKVTDKDAENFYKKNKEQFMVPKRAQVVQILIDSSPDSIKRQITDNDKKGSLSQADIEAKVRTEVERKEALAEEVRAKAVKNPASFPDLVKQYSEDKQSAQKGGDIGYITEGQVAPEVAKVAFSQKIGTISPVIKTQFGSHIIIVKDRTPAGMQSLNEVKNDLKKFLATQKKSEVLQKYIKGLKDSAKIEYVDSSLNPENLKKQADEALKKQIEREQKNQPQGNSSPRVPQPAPANVPAPQEKE